MQDRAHAGSTVDDLCRACKMVRRHTVAVVGLEGEIFRVLCDYCGSQHNYRGGARHRSSEDSATASADTSERAFPLVAEPERSGPPMSSDASTAGTQDLEMLLRRIIREEIGLTPVTPADKWRGGEVVLRPANPELQEKSWPIETFFHKVVMVRNRLRLLEQQVNGADLPEQLKIKLQGYVTGCYGSLTSFNVLFAEEGDHFRGTGRGGQT